MVTFSILDAVRRQRLGNQDLPADPAEDDPVESEAALQLFFECFWDCAPCSYADRTGDLDSVVLVSDFYTPREFRATAMWSEYLRPYGVAREMIACLGGVPGRTVRLFMWRGPGRDFDDRERALLWLLRPHLYRLYRERQNPPRTELTPRQRELLCLVAAGHTNRQIGRRLGVTESTVRKHLEHVFERLRVGSRTEAVFRAFPDGVRDLA